MSKALSHFKKFSMADEIGQDPCRLIDLEVIDSTVSEEDHETTVVTTLRLDPCVDLTRLLSKGKIQVHLASHLYEVDGVTDTVTLERLYVSDYVDQFTLSMSHPSTESLIGGTVVSYESGKVVFFPVFQSTSKRLVETRVYLTHEFTKTMVMHSEDKMYTKDKSTDSYGSTPQSMTQHRVAETSYAFTVIDGYRQLSEDDLEEAFVWFLTHRSFPAHRDSGHARRLMVDCPKGYRPHTLIVEYWEGPSVLTNDNEVIAKVAVSLIPVDGVSLHAISRDDWNLTQGAVPSFYVDIPLTFEYVDIPPTFEPTNQGTYRYSIGDHMVSVRYSESPDGGIRVRMYLPAGMDLPDNLILTWSKNPTLGIPQHPLDESTNEATVSKESVVDESTKANKETKMTIQQRTEYKLEQPTSKDGLLWTTSLRLGKDHPRGIVEVAGQCSVLDSDGLLMHHYREVRSDTVSAKLIGLWGAETFQYDSHNLELTVPKGWVPQNVWLHVITSSEDPEQCRMELDCDFRIEGSKEEHTTSSAQISGWHCEGNVMDSGPLFEAPDDYRPGLSTRPILTGKVVLESGQELGRETSQTILESIKVYPTINMFSKRFSVSLEMPDKYQVRPMTGTASLVHLPDQDAYHLELDCDFTFTPANPFQHTCGRHDRHVEATKVTKSQEDAVVESPNDPTLFDTLFHSCKFVTEAVSTEHSIELELPYEFNTNRIAIISTQDPKDQSYVHSRAQLSPSLIKRNEYLLRLVTAPGVVISDVRHRLDQEDVVLIQVDIHRPQDTGVLPVNPEPLIASDDSPKSSQTGDTADDQSPWTPKQLVKEIYANRDRRIVEILQSVNNYFTFSVREELCTDPNIKCVLESPVPENLMHKLYVTLTDAGYVVEIDNEKLNFTVELPSAEYDTH